MLKKEQEGLFPQAQGTALEIKREASLLCGLCQRVSEWRDDPLVESVTVAADEVQHIYTGFCGCDERVFTRSPGIFEQAQEITGVFMDAVREAACKVEERLHELNNEQDRRLADLANLRRNIKDYPKGLRQLKDRISAGLRRQTGREVRVEILADVLEITEGEERWRKAAEGYLHTQKFYLLVEPEHYQKAPAFYDEIKSDYPDRSFGLVDIGKLRERERIVVWADSLAQKLETDNDLARTYIDYLLGRMVCCAHVSQLRRHKTAVTADGMLYQGYVARPMRREQMEDAFIGRKAVALRIERMEAEVELAGREIAAWTSIGSLLTKHKGRDALFTQFFVHSTVEQRRRDYQRGMEITEKVNRIDEELSRLDVFWLQEQRRQIDILKREIAALEKEKTRHTEEKVRLKEHIRRLEYEELPELYGEMTKKEDTLSERFTQNFVERVGIPRYRQEFARLKRASTVAKNFQDRLSQTQNKRNGAQGRLFKAQQDYVSTFQPCSFHIDAMVNDEFAQEQQCLEKSELPKYREKIKAAKESAMEQFQNDFLAKLKSGIDQVQDQVKSLNKALKQAKFGTAQYQFRVDRDPDYGEYYDMIMAPELMEREGGLFVQPFQQKYGKLMENLFSCLATSDDTQLNARKQSELQQNIERYTDFGTYLNFDLETTDQNDSKQLLSQTLNTKSGGETQTPFYIAVLASFAQLYQVNNLSALANNTVWLVVFDEAFNKMDRDRIAESVRLLWKMGLQAIICTPPDKLSDIMPLADKTFLVSKDKYKMHIL